MKKVFSILILSLLFIGGANAFPSWIGVYTPHVNISPAGPYNTGTSITFQVFQNQDYTGLHCDFGLKYAGVDTYYTMTYNGNIDGNSVWFITMSFPLAPGSYEFWFKGWEDFSSSEIYDSNGGSNYSFTVDSPLPVDLKLFEAKSKGNSISLNWVTASEMNSDYFQLERSLTGEKFSIVEKIQAAGNSNSELHYNYVDRYVGSTVVYYRLLQFDFDGSKTVFNTISIAPKNEESLFYPNPTTDKIFFSIVGEHKKIEIYDSKFRLVKSEVAEFNFIDVSELQTGIYFIKHSEAKGDKLQKIIKQ